MNFIAKLAIFLQWCQLIVVWAAFFLIVKVGGIGFEEYTLREALAHGLTLMAIPLLWSTAAAVLILKRRTSGWWLSIGWNLVTVFIAIWGVRTNAVDGDLPDLHLYIGFLLLAVISSAASLLPIVRPKNLDLRRV